MKTDKATNSLEQEFSSLSADDLENLDVEELEQRLELAAIDYMTIVKFFAVRTPGCKALGVWGC